MRNGSLKTRLQKLSDSLIDPVSSEIIIKEEGKVIAYSKSERPSQRLIRIVVNFNDPA